MAEIEIKKMNGIKLVDEPFRSFKSKDDEAAYILNLLKSIYDGSGVPEGYEEWSGKEQIEWFKKQMKWTDSMPKSLLYLAVSILRPMDCKSTTEKPEWLDMDKFRRGQKFALDNFCSISLGEILGLMQVFTFKMGLEPIAFTGNSHTPYASFRRYLSTEKRIRNWYREDPWTKGTAAYKDVQVVRSMHIALRNKLSQHGNSEIREICTFKDPCAPLQEVLKKDFHGTCPVLQPGQCPIPVVDEFPCRPKGMNQGDMSAVQFAFVSLVIYAPEKLGIHGATNEDLDAFCHVWRGIGYLLGIEDEFNFCRGTLDEIRQRTHDFVEYWVKPNFRMITPEWEQVMRSLLEGVSYYFAGFNFELILMHLAKIFDFDMPRFYASLDYVTWIKWKIMGPTIDYMCKIPMVVTFLNSRINYVIDKASEYTPDEHQRLKEKSRKALERWRVPINVS